MEEAQIRNSAIKEECVNMVSQLRSQRHLTIDNEVEVDQLTKHIIMVKDREACLLEDKANLEIREKHRLLEIRALHEAMVAKTKDKDTQLR
jgi:hypothetical protein